MAKGKVNAGDSFNNWTVLHEIESSNGKQFFMCKCVCGVCKPVRKCNLGNVKGCGCDRGEYKARTHKPVQYKPKQRTTVKAGKNKVTATKPAKQLKKKPSVKSGERTKSSRELLEERLEQIRLEKQLSEVFE